MTAKPIISFINRKGGVGKTSCAHHLGGQLAEQGKTVLLLDLWRLASKS